MASLYLKATLSVACCTIAVAHTAPDGGASGLEKSSLNTANFPASAVDTSAEVELISSEASLDAPKISLVNATTFDWWYFEAVSSAVDQGFFITFNLAGHDSLYGGSNDSVAYASVYGIFQNGTLWNETIPASIASVMTTVDGSSSGVWKDTGASWTSTKDYSNYVITLDGPAVKGVVQMDSTAPPHYPCGPVETGSDLLIGPGVAWANPLPDADVSVYLEVDGQPVNFKGTGYHDKNWGTQFFPNGFNTWYWGRARVGEYSVVWFNVLAPESAGGNRFSGYVSKDGQILHAACGPDSIKVRPIGTPYPRGNDPNWATGFSIEVDLGTHGSLKVSASNDVMLIDGGGFSKRHFGKVYGTVNGENVTGHGLWEDLWLPLS